MDHRRLAQVTVLVLVDGINVAREKTFLDTISVQAMETLPREALEGLVRTAALKAMPAMKVANTVELRRKLVEVARRAESDDESKDGTA